MDDSGLLQATIAFPLHNNLEARLSFRIDPFIRIIVAVGLKDLAAVVRCLVMELVYLRVEVALEERLIVKLHVQEVSAAIPHSQPSKPSALFHKLVRLVL